MVDDLKNLKKSFYWMLNRKTEDVDDFLKNIKKTISILGLTERVSSKSTMDNWSGDLIGADKKRTFYVKEVSAFPGDSGRASNTMAEIYELYVNHNGSFAYLSLVLEGNFLEEVFTECNEKAVKNLEELSKSAIQDMDAIKKMDQNNIHSHYKDHRWIDSIERELFHKINK